MRYALIKENKVENIIEVDVSNKDAFPNVLEIGDYLVQIGDEVIDGIFYHNGQKVMTRYEENAKRSADMAEALGILGVQP